MCICYTDGAVAPASGPSTEAQQGVESRWPDGFRVSMTPQTADVLSLLSLLLSCLSLFFSPISPSVSLAPALTRTHAHTRSAQPNRTHRSAVLFSSWNAARRPQMLKTSAVLLSVCLHLCLYLFGCMWIYLSESGVAALRAQCAAAGIVVYERVIQRLLRYPDLILRLSGCIYPELYIKLYDAAHQRLGSSTKAAVVAVDRNRNVVITDVVVTSSSKSDFYYAFDECKPCFLKLSKEPNTVAMLEREAQIYETARLRAPDGLSSLVPVELIELEDPRPLFVGRGGINVLKMQIYVRTVSNCVFDPRLSQLFVRVGIEVLKAISALHEVGFVHCDVKPSNIFISSMGTVHLGDYDATTELGLLVNRSTERYMPEPYRTQFNTGTLRASPALDKAMLMLTLLECLGIQLSPDLQIDRAIDEAAEEVETFRNRGGSHSPAVMAIETAKGDIVEMLRSLHQSI